MRLAKFQDAYNAEVYVNPDLVTYIRAQSDDKTVVHFAEGHSITVKMRIGDVASGLFNAGKP